MPKQIVLLSGNVSCGKSTLAEQLASRFEFQIVKTKNILRQLDPSVAQERSAMQRLGEKLDRQTNGEWVRNGLRDSLKDQREDSQVVVDSVRIAEQINAIRRAYGRSVIHIHLSAEIGELKKRYARRPRKGFEEFGNYDEVLKNRTEKRVDALAKVADIVINTDRSNIDDVTTRTACQLGLYLHPHDRLVDVIGGCQYGSEGKGNIVQYLAKEYALLVRVGGPNAGHTVYEEPAPHIFHHLPSGTRSSEARLVLGPGMVINVRVLMKEIAKCEVSKNRLSIDPNAMIIEDADIKIEKRGLVGGIGSTGQGVGAATARRILNRHRADILPVELFPNVRLAKDIKDLSPYLRETLDVLEDAFSHGEKVLLEGTQGTGLSLYHGMYPYVTSRDTTVAGCLAEAGISPGRVRRVILTCRSYPIRAGNPKKKKKGTSGPMSKDLSFAELARRSEIPEQTLKKKEIGSTTGRLRRFGEFDWTLLRKAAFLNGPTDIALTFADYLSPKNTEARRFEQLTPETLRFIEEIESVTCAPVSLISTRFNFRNIIDRRSW